ncbi:MAG: DNRLRE domain-containing protein [Syntrophomonadaceae bacterium]|nr:DNRLRE domain-containing protein [Syntrophomonadaceae bacterium]
MSCTNDASSQTNCCYCTEICFFPSQDAYIAEFYPDINFGNVPYLYVSQYNCPTQLCPCPDDYRSLLKFDLCSLGCNYIPPNSEICYAYLELSIYRNEVPSEIEVCLHKVLAPWEELSVNWSNQPPIFPEPEYCSTVSSGYFDKLYFDVCSLVRGWYSGCCANNGIMLIGNEEFNSLVGFYSQEFPNSLLWPKLVVGYVQKCCIPYFNSSNNPV